MLKKFILLLSLFFVSYNAIHADTPSHVQAVVFDFGGVIATANRALMVDFLKNTFSIDEQELRQALHDMHTYSSENRSERQFWQSYAKTKGVKLPADWEEQFEAVITQAIHPIPATISIVKELKRQGYQVALLSDVTEHQARIIRRMGYYDLFQPALLSYEIGVEKPNPEAFQILIKTLHLPATDILFIDDKIENVDAAKQQGIDAIQFISPEQLLHELQKRKIEILL